jgi:hypothetical protein
MSTKYASNIEGPYWDYTAATNWINRERNMYARLAADTLLEPGRSKQAREYAVEYRKRQTVADRIHARYESTKDDDGVIWIGWNAQSGWRL